MQKQLEQLYDGDLCPSERSVVCITHFKAAREVAVQAHDAFEERLCAALKIELDEYLSKESDVNAYHTK